MITTDKPSEKTIPEVPSSIKMDTFLMYITFVIYTTHIYTDVTFTDHMLLINTSVLINTTVIRRYVIKLQDFVQVHGLVT